MKLVNKQTLIASLEESVRELTIALEDAKKSESRIYELRDSLSDFKDELAELEDSLELLDYKEGHIEANEQIHKILLEKGMDILDTLWEDRDGSSDSDMKHRAKATKMTKEQFEAKLTAEIESRRLQKMARPKGSKNMANGTSKAEVPERIVTETEITDGGVKSIFSLDTFEKEQKVYTYTVPVVKTFDAVGDLLTFEEKIAALQTAIENKAAKEARKNVSSGNNIPPTVVNGLMNTFRIMPKFSVIEDRKAQTKAISEFLKGQPAMIESLKVMALAAGDDDSADSEDSEG